MSMDKETEKLFATFRPDMLKNRFEKFKRGDMPVEDDLLDDVRGDDDAMTVAEFKEGMEKFDELLAQLKELQSKFVGIIKAPPTPVVMSKKIDSFEELVGSATGYSKYVSCYKKAREWEEKVNDSKLRMFAFLYYVKTLEPIFNNHSAEELYNFAFADIPQVVAVWRIHSRDLGLPLEEYVNKYVKV
jgi:hypothetical protein